MIPAELQRRDLRRLVKDLWGDPRCDHLAVATVDAAVAANAQSLDRSVLTAYLRHFPREHPAFEHLRSAARFTASRRPWDWRARGETWQLWDHDEAPKRLARSLLESETGADALRGAGLDGDLAQGRLVAEAVTSACLEAGKAKGERAEHLGRKLIELFRDMSISGKDSLLSWALLAPWSSTKPSKEYQNLILKMVQARIGDPRKDANSWQACLAELNGAHPSIDAKGIFATAKRWVVSTAVKQFFDIVARTTDNPHQWAQRTVFWSAYLDVDLIDDAWFVLGPRAEQLFRMYREIELEHGLIRAGEGGAGHSALIMKIGDLLIAEWSDNGACRFWPLQHPDAPKLGEKLYHRSKLKTRAGDGGFEKIAHLPSPGWEPKIAGKVFRSTAIRHPRLGVGASAARW